MGLDIYLWENDWRRDRRSVRSLDGIDEIPADDRKVWYWRSRDDLLRVMEAERRGVRMAPGRRHSTQWGDAWEIAWRTCGQKVLVGRRLRKALERHCEKRRLGSPPKYVSRAEWARQNAHDKAAVRWLRSVHARGRKAWMLHSW